jgi:hypothetical protein
MNPKHANKLINILTTQGEIGLVNTVKTQIGKLLVGSDNFDTAKDLIETIANNSIQYAYGSQMVLGKWVNYSDGFTKISRNTSSMHYNPHPEIWNTLEELGINRDVTAWLVNKQVVQTGIAKGLPINFTLEGIPVKEIETEKKVVDLIFSGTTDLEIMSALGIEKLAIRWQELIELQKAGYKLVSNLDNSYIFSLP